jgi:peptidoglycan hydrolase CwlO-like protein
MTSIPSNYSYKEVLSLHADKIPAFLLPWLEEVVEKATEYDICDYTSKEVENELSDAEDTIVGLEGEIADLTRDLNNAQEEIADLESELSDAQDTIANLEERESNV